jgi:hypothetical protein
MNLSWTEHRLKAFKIHRIEVTVFTAIQKLMVLFTICTLRVSVPDPDVFVPPGSRPLVRGTDSGLDPIINKQNSKKTPLISCFVTYLLLFIFEE